MKIQLEYACIFRNRGTGRCMQRISYFFHFWSTLTFSIKSCALIFYYRIVTECPAIISTEEITIEPTECSVDPIFEQSCVISCTRGGYQLHPSDYAIVSCQGNGQWTPGDVGDVSCLGKM